MVSGMKAKVLPLSIVGCASSSEVRALRRLRMKDAWTWTPLSCARHGSIGAGTRIGGADGADQVLKGGPNRAKVKEIRAGREGRARTKSGKDCESSLDVRGKVGGGYVGSAVTWYCRAIDTMQVKLSM